MPTLPPTREDLRLSATGGDTAVAAAWQVAAHGPGPALPVAG